MSKLFDRLFTVIDKTTEAGTRKTAQKIGRRSFLAKAGVVLAGTVAMPLLPFDRSLGGLAMAASGAGGDINDEFSCDYWRHCALDGSLCSTSGGTLTSCPPGSEASKVAWVGTCRNPNDGKDYLVSYNDCCGKPTVSTATTCFRSEGERPGYRMGLHNDINWCMANANKGYHCTVSVVVGLADA